MKGIRYPVLSIIFCFVFAGGCKNYPSLYRESRVVMGTFAEVISSDEKALKIAFEEIKRIEGLLSKYDPDSEVSRLNSNGELKASPETYYVVKTAKEISLASNGAFDITVGPLLDLWGFKDKKYRLPAKEEIGATLKKVGSDKVVLNDADNSIKFAVSGMGIDLGAIAKGYAVDCAVRKLKANGINSAIVGIGGDIYCLGTKAGRPWIVAIRSPDKKGFKGRLKLVNQAVSTSGNYEQFFIKDHKRYAHIFNPKTGVPVDSGIAGVTVVAQDCLTADALATAIFALGEEKGRDLSEKFPHVKIKIIKATKNR